MRVERNGLGANLIRASSPNAEGLYRQAPTPSPRNALGRKRAAGAANPLIPGG